VQYNPNADGQGFVGDYPGTFFYTFASGSRRWINAWTAVPTAPLRFDIWLSAQD